MTKRSSTPADAVLVAIDMSKHHQEVLIERPEGGRRRRMTVMATKAAYDRLATDLGDIGHPVIVGFEATGNYHRTLAHRLLAAGFELRLISSVCQWAPKFPQMWALKIPYAGGSGRSVISRIRDQDFLSLSAGHAASAVVD